MHHLSALTVEEKERAVVALAAAGFETHKIEFMCGGMRARDADIVTRYLNGDTLDLIGSAYNMTRERVRQIVRARGISITGTQRHAARLLRTQIKLAKKKQVARDARRMRYYGCNNGVFLELNQGLPPSRVGSRAFSYINQVKNAIARGIAWELNFPEWCRIWSESGKEPLRGRGKGRYCMSRIGDSGPYKLGNVEIITNQQNSSDSFVAHPAADRRRIARDELGLVPGQRRIYDAYMAGFTSPKAIADQLQLSRNTVSTVLVTLRNTGKIARQHSGAA